MEISRRSSRLLQIAVVAVAIIITALVSYQIKNTRSYEETGTVVFTAKQLPAQADASFNLVQSLTTTGEVMVQALMSQDSHSLARRAGGAAAFSAQIINYNNEDFPDYAFPFATLVVQGSTLEGVQATFRVVIRMLRNMLSDKQTQAGVLKAKQVTMSIVDVAGPLMEKPSRVRVYAALSLLSVIGTGMSLIFIRRLLPSERATPLVSDYRVARGGSARSTQ